MYIGMYTFEYSAKKQVFRVHLIKPFPSQILGAFATKFCFDIIAECRRCRKHLLGTLAQWDEVAQGLPCSSYLLARRTIAERSHIV